MTVHSRSSRRGRAARRAARPEHPPLAHGSAARAGRAARPAAGLAQEPGEREIVFPADREGLAGRPGLSAALAGLRVTGFAVGSFNSHSAIQIVPEVTGGRRR
ncbi:MAG TPA: hypothetical protein VNM66_06825 [Thermodesulfobacteriota bacterium]|nr:hypothetical protein [Thermodesulfobacteriota bacterium]